MEPAAPPSLWQTFFNLGGIAGALSLLWQVTNTIREHYRKPRLRILEFVQNRDIFNVRFDAPASPDERRYVTMQVKNVGRRYARGCVARATATPISGVSATRQVSLHWADTPIVYRTTGESQVDIAPGGLWRLDVAFSSKRGVTCLASDSALYGSYYSGRRASAGRTPRRSSSNLR